MIDKQGIYGLSMEEYQYDPVIVPSLTRGTIRTLVSECPLKAWVRHRALNPDYLEEKSSKFDLGSAVHSLFLEGVDIAVPLDFDDWRKKEGRELRDKAWSEGKIPLLRGLYEEAKKMVKSAEDQLSESELGIMALRAEGFSEQSYIWKEGETWCRIRPDWVSSDNAILIDLKTTSLSADPNSYARQIIAAGTDIQAAFYTRGVKAITGIEPRFIVMVLEIEEPYLCSFMSLSPQFLELGKEKVNEGLRIWRECMATGVWRGYPNQICHLDAPAWALTQWGERRLSIQIEETPDPTEAW